MKPIAFLSILLAATAAAQDFPPPGNLGPVDTYGANLQRSLGLMAGSTPEHHNTVRVLFYGQSITEQDWSKKVAAKLRERFPNADLQIENRAIGGHSSQILIKTAEADLYPFYPDLLIFHVYGDHTKYEDIIRRVRERTTADVLLQTDHLNANQTLDEETDPSKLDMSSWVPWFNYSFLPGLSHKLGTELADQRNLWKNYLREHKLEPSALLKDNVHLNEQGNFLMAEIVDSYLHLRPDLAKPDNRVTTVPVSAGDWKDGKLTHTFTGNRIDAILADKGEDSEVKTAIDGSAPATFAFTKSTGYNGTNWPCLLQAQRGTTALVPETWTLTILESNDDYSQFRFSLEGSVTGMDGEGSATETFTSKSGRIVIEPDDWNLAYCRKVYEKRLPDDARISFQVIPQFQEKFTAKADGDPTREAVVTLSQGLLNTEHTLTLTSGKIPAISALRIYTPPLATAE